MRAKLFRRTASALLALLFAFGMFPGAYTAASEELATYEIADADKTWYDPAASEYTVSTPGELAYFSELAKSTTFAGKTVKLGADIVLNEGEASAYGFSGKQGSALRCWTPIGPGTSNPFQGSFDGQGHVISGMYISSNTQNMGLFGVVKNCTIKDMTLSDCYIELSKAGEPTPSWAGILVSQSWGDNVVPGMVIRNSYLLGDLAESEYLGALVGCAASASGTNTYVNCSFSGSIRGKDAVGGLIGLVRNKKKAVLENCTVTGDICASADCGGIIGRVCGSCELKNTHFFGSATSDTPAAAAALAYLEKKDQGGTLQADDSEAVFSSCYFASGAQPVALAEGESKFDVEVSYPGGESNSRGCIGVPEDAQVINSFFRELPLPVSASSRVSFAGYQAYSDSGRRNVRLVASLSSVSSSKYAGFNVCLLTGDGAKELGDLFCSSVFGILEPVGDAPGSSAPDGQGLFALTFRGIPGSGSAIIVATPFAASEKQNAEYGIPVIGVFINGIAAAEYVYR